MRYKTRKHFSNKSGKYKLAGLHFSIQINIAKFKNTENERLYE